MMNGDSENLETEIVTITPSIAREWLRLLAPNRPLSKSLVELYATAMREGRWRLNGETMQFSTTGLLVNGQHRVNACIRANVSFKALVVYGVSESSFATMDQGRKRSGGDVLSMRHIPNAGKVSAAARLICCLDRRPVTVSKFMLRVPNDLIEHYLAKHARLPEIIQESRRREHIVAASALSALVCIAETMWPEEYVRVFCEKLESGAEMDADDPIFVLRERLLRVKSAGRIRGSGTFSQFLAVGLLFKGFNDWVAGARIKKIVFTDKDEVPPLLGPADVGDRHDIVGIAPLMAG